MEYIDNDFYDEEEYDADEEEEFDCGAYFDARGRFLGCTKVGSEECDWECPYLAAFEREAEEEDTDGPDNTAR